MGHYVGQCHSPADSAISHPVGGGSRCLILLKKVIIIIQPASSTCCCSSGGGGGGGAIIKTPPVSDPADTSVSLSVSPFLSPEQPFSCHLGLMRNTVEFHWAGKLNITVSVLLETSHSPQSRLNYSEM